jgi:hypothetical protein
MHEHGDDPIDLARAWRDAELPNFPGVLLNGNSKRQVFSV